MGRGAPSSWQLALAAQMLEHEALPQQTTRIVRDAAQLMLHGLFALVEGCLGLLIGLATGGGSGLLAAEQVLFAGLGARPALIRLLASRAVLCAGRGGRPSIILTGRLRAGFFRRGSRRARPGLVAFG